MESYSEKILKIKRHPSEMPLFITMLVIALCLWVCVFMSVIGGIYALGIGVFILFGHASMIAYIRGNGVQVNEEQFPELHELVVHLSKQINLKKIPEVYILQSGGALNALATKFIRSKIIVIFSDLLEACDDNTDAMRMIIGHEMGHIKSGHLSWEAVLMPAKIVPFLGQAFSRAREYTCDRYGASVVEVKSNAVLGLTILSVGKNYAAKVSKTAMVKQSQHLNTGWMRIGEWLQSHPSLIKRIYALEPEFKSVSKKSSPWANVKGLLIIFSVFAILCVGTFGAISFFKNEIERIESK